MSKAKSENNKSENNKSENNRISPDLDTPTDLPPAAVNKISEALNVLLADAFALYVKTKNFHWHVSGRHFRDYHLMLDEQSDAIFATTDQLAELMADNKAHVENMRKAHKLADEHEDVATASLLEVFIDEAEKRAWFLFEASRGANPSGH